jgi:crotonobetainyl-CoA:carnitine CoA-transferase CaiB-like acyl-CoA transferase
MSDPVGLLEGIRLLDLSDSGTQLAGRLLAELGATVLRVEPPTGDPSRRTGPFAHDTEDAEGSLTFAALNSGKLSVVLDPQRPDAASVLGDLAGSVDAVLLSATSLWAEFMDAEAVVRGGRSVVMVHGFAPGGPYSSYLAPEIVTTAAGGLLYISGDRDLPPCSPPEAIGQYFGGVWAALALVCAVRMTRQDRPAALYRVSTHEALATQEHLIRAAAMDGESITRNGSQHKSVAPANVFPTRDGWVYIYVSRNHWAPFLGAWDPHPEEFDDPSLVPNSARRVIADRLNAAVSSWTRQYGDAELVALLQRAGVPCLPVNRPSDFLADAQVVARELFAPTDHPTLGSFRQIRFPAVVNGHRPPPTRPPVLGEHTVEVLGALPGGVPTR